MGQGTIVIWVLTIKGKYVECSLDPKALMRDQFVGKWKSNGFHEFRAYDDRREVVATLFSETLSCEGAALSTVLANLRPGWDSATTTRISRPERNPVNPIIE